MTLKKFLPCCKEGRNGRNEEQEHCFFQNGLLPKQIRQAHTKQACIDGHGTDVEISSLLLTLSSANTHPHHAHCPSPRTEHCSHWESRNSWFSHDTWKVLTVRPRRWDFSKGTKDSTGFAQLRWLTARSERLGCLKLFRRRYQKRCNCKLQELLSKVLPLNYLFKVFLFKIRSSCFKPFSFESLSILKMNLIQFPLLNADSHYHNSHLDNTLLHIPAHWHIQHCFETKFLLLTLMTKKPWIEISLCYMLTIKWGMTCRKLAELHRMEMPHLY